MEYKVGDRVIVSEGIEYYVVEIKNKYNLFNVGIVFDGIRINDNEIITFKNSDIIAESTKLKNMIAKYDEVIKKEVSEENKYLKTWEAIKALEEGKSIRRKDWNNKNYRLIKDKNGDILEIDNEGLKELADDVIDSCDLKATDWEIYEEPKKEIPKEFEGLKYILGSINNMDCGDKDCDKCPLGMEKCDMLDEIFFDMKEKYNF